MTVYEGASSGLITVAISDEQTDIALDDCHEMIEAVMLKIRSTVERHEGRMASERQQHKNQQTKRELCKSRSLRSNQLYMGGPPGSSQ